MDCPNDVSSQVWPTKIRVPKLALVVPSLFFLFCTARNTRADDLVPKSSRQVKRDVIAQSLFTIVPTGDSIDYWMLSNGSIREVSAPATDYQVDFRPEKLATIRDQWKRAGATVIINYNDGRPPLELNNCFMTWKPPAGTTIGFTIGNGGFLSAYKEREDGAASLGLDVVGESPFVAPNGIPFEKGLIPLFNIEAVEFGQDGSVKVSMKDGPTFSARMGNYSMQLVGGQGRADFIPYMTGFTYEDGAYGEEKTPSRPVKKYFVEHSVAISEIRKLTIGNPVSFEDAKPEITNLKVESNVSEFSHTVDFYVSFHAVGKIGRIVSAGADFNDYPEIARSTGAYLPGDPILREEEYRATQLKLPYGKYSITVTATDQYGNTAVAKTVWPPARRPAPKTR